MGFILLVLGVIHALRQLTRPKDYSIRRVYLEYTVSQVSIDVSEFWAREKKKWETLPDVYSVDINGKDRSYLPIPECIEDVVIKIVYMFNNKEYIYTTKDFDYSWPPKKSHMSFVLPFKNAVLLGKDNKPVKNITRQLNQYAGPRYDYHGSDATLLDMIDKPFTKLRVTNIMNQESILNLGC